MPSILLVLGSPVYAWRSPRDVLDFAVDVPSTIELASVILHFVAWLVWLLFLKITIAEWVLPSQSGGLGSRVLRRMFAATGILAVSINTVDFPQSPEVAHEDNSSSVRPAITSQPAAIQSEIRNHTVQIGDSWLSLADRYMADPASWQYVRSLNLNRVMPDGETVTSGTHIIKPGWTLRVPVADSNRIDGVVPNIDTDGAFERQASLILSGLGAAGALIATEVVEALRSKRRRRNVTRPSGKFVSDVGVRPTGYETAINHLASTKKPNVVAVDVPIKQSEDITDNVTVSKMRLMVSKDKAVDLGRLRRLVVGGNDLSCGQFFNSAILQLLLLEKPLKLFVSQGCQQMVASFDQIHEIKDIDLHNLMIDHVPEPLSQEGAVLFCRSAELLPYQIDRELLTQKRLYLVVWEPAPGAQLDIELDKSGDISIGSIPDNEPAQMVSAEAAEAVCSLLADIDQTETLEIKASDKSSWNKHMLRVLGRVELLSQAKLTERQLSLVTYLVVNGPSSRSQLKEALWDGQRVTDKTFSNLVSETRSILGRQLFPTASQGRYQVVGITSDLDRLRELVELGSEATNGQLKAGLDLVNGSPFTVESTTHWSWISYHSYVYAEAEACVVDIASELSLRCLVKEDFHGAFTALKLGLKAVQTDEKLISRLVEVCESFGKQTTADRLRKSWLNSTGHNLREDIFRTRPAEIPDALDSDYAQAFL